MWFEAIDDGEDFELLFSLDEERYSILNNKWRHETKITVIGRMNESGKLSIKYDNGRVEELKAVGFDHLRIDE